jgi:hypothetical protein
MCLYPTGLTVGPRERPKATAAEAFLRHTYFSVAETLPHNLELVEETKTSAVVYAQMVDAILDAACVNPVEQATRKGPSKWPVRHLPPGRLGDLYMLYTAYARARASTPAGPETFRKVWRRGWDKALVFRKASCHSMCQTCSELKTIARHAESLDEHISACGRLVTHLRDQWRDREVYWNLRARARAEKDVLLIIGDGMDRSKFGLPQWDGGRAPKHSAVEHNPRPTCEVYACIAHGFRVDIFICGEGIVTGASFAADMLMRTMDGVWQQCQRTGQSFPLDVSIQGDNTTKEIKNSIMGRCLAALTVAGVFRAAAHMHLRVGHTHEDIDQMFGLIARTVNGSFKRAAPIPPTPSVLVLGWLVGGFWKGSGWCLRWCTVADPFWYTQLCFKATSLKYCLAF